MKSLENFTAAQFLPDGGFPLNWVLSVAVQQNVVSYQTSEKSSRRKKSTQNSTVVDENALEQCSDGSKLCHPMNSKIICPYLFRKF